MLQEILNMPYVDFMAFIKETNRAPWWEKILLEMARSTFLNDSKRILHIACNTWSSLRELTKLTWCKWIWIDINKNMVSIALELKEKDNYTKNLDFKQMNAQNLDFKNQEFDIVLTTWGMAFVPDKPKVVKEMVRTCKDNWFIVVWLCIIKKS